MLFPLSLWGFQEWHIWKTTQSMDSFFWVCFNTHQLTCVFFALVTMIFLSMLTGNGLLTIVILVDTCLHTPIYFFLWSCLSLMSSLLLPLYPRWWWTIFCSKGSSLLLVVALRSSCGWLWEELSVSSWVSCPVIEMLLSASLYTSHSTWTCPSVGRWHFAHWPGFQFLDPYYLHYEIPL